ncbi:MAG: HD domain-containing protein, partial [Oscillospiraceae bacterium]|nr:HD domain-containing protein [Oscillospiraceae bacterium]
MQAQFQNYTALLRARLSKKRFVHSVNVAESARELAVRWNADPDWAYLAGLLHDCCKELPAEEQEALMRSGSFDVEDLPSDYPDFIRAVREAIHLYQLPDLLRESICSYRRPRASDYIYCEVSFPEGFHTYHYRTEDRTIQEEDY